jgi:hypothetical protein
MSNQEEFDTEPEAEQDIILTEPDLRQLSPLDWARYGTNRIAYLRPVLVNNQRSVAIHAADGASALNSSAHFTRASFCSTSAAITPPP